MGKCHLERLTLSDFFDSIFHLFRDIKGYNLKLQVGAERYP